MGPMGPMGLPAASLGNAAKDQTGQRGLCTVADVGVDAPPQAAPRVPPPFASRGEDRATRATLKLTDSEGGALLGSFRRRQGGPSLHVPWPESGLRTRRARFASSAFLRPIPASLDSPSQPSWTQKRPRRSRRSRSLNPGPHWINLLSFPTSRALVTWQSRQSLGLGGHRKRPTRPSATVQLTTSDQRSSASPSMERKL